jgi:hypothetical protein
MKYTESHATSQVPNNAPRKKQSFTSKKLDCIDALIADPRLSPRAKVVGVCIIQHINQHTGTWPLSDQTISEKTGGMPVRWIKYARAELRDLKWIEWQRTGDANLYRALYGNVAEIEAKQKELAAARKKLWKTSKNSWRRRPNEVRPVAHHDAVDEVRPVAHHAADEARPVALCEVRPAAHKHLPSTFAKESTPSTLSSPARNVISLPVADEFETFWKTYPERKQGKAKALQAYQRAVKKASAETIQAGVERYALERQAVSDPQERHQFTKLAATWLNGEHWNDEPAPMKRQARSYSERVAMRTSDNDPF